MEAASKLKDNLKINSNKIILQQLDRKGGEEVIYSVTVLKFNRFGLRQDRTLLITNFSIYNIKGDQIKRKIPLYSIQAITKSKLVENFQFVIHIKNEYDYMFESPSRKEIFNAIKYCFFQEVGMNVPVFGVPDNLRDYHTSKKDIVAGVQILPESHFR